MKTIKIHSLTLALLSAVTFGAHAQTSTPAVKDDLFAGTEKFAQNATSVTQIDMDPESLGMVEGSNSNRARRTVLNVVHTYEYDKPGQYNPVDVEAYRNKLNTGDWHCSIHTYEQKAGTSTDVCNKRRTDGMEEKAIITVSPKELTFIHTIRRTGSTGSGTSTGTGTSGSSGTSSWSNSSEMYFPMMPADIGSWNEPGHAELFQAEMTERSIEMQAQMQVQMAELRADTVGLSFPILAPSTLNDLQHLTIEFKNDPQLYLNSHFGPSKLETPSLRELQKELQQLKPATGK